MFWLGQVGLWVLTLAATVAAAAPGRRWVRRGSRLATLGGVVALGVLAVAFATEDWRFAYAVGHARPDVAWPLRVAGIWAGPEGSLLLWTVMMSAATLICGRLATSVLSVRFLAALTTAYGAATAAVANPFERLPAPPGAGNGLQPVLEHPAMVWHPPVLYMGLVGLLVPVALILGSRRTSSVAGQNPNPDPGPDVGPALTSALAALTAGLATGANWAYVELGWGGYWAWDPIENAGLVAWLAAASMLHQLTPASVGTSDAMIPADVTDSTPGSESADAANLVHRAAKPLPTLVRVFAALTAVAVIWATTITRTGVLSSVHSFADEPALRTVLLAIAVVFTALTITVLVAATRNRQPSRPRSGLAAGVLLAATLIVAVGTYEPAVELLLSRNPFVLSGRFYTLLLWPVAIAAAVGRVSSTTKGEPGSSQRRVTVGLAVASVGATVAMVLVTASVGLFGLVLAGAGGAVAGSAAADQHSKLATIRTGSRLAHLGIGLLMVGVAGTTASTSTSVVALVGQRAETPVGIIVHQSIELEDGPGTSEAVATLDIFDPEGETFQRFNPRLVSYRRSGASSAEVATKRGWMSDTQVVLLDAGANQATYRIIRQPRILLIWVGAAAITLGLALSARPHRSAHQLSKSTRPGL